MNTEDKNHEPVGGSPEQGAGPDGGYFSLPELDQRLDLLFHLAENSDRIPLVKGDEGLGKTVMLDQLALRAQPNWRLCRVLADPMLQPEQLFSRIAQCAGASESNNLDSLVRRFEDLLSEGVLVVVAVDDAHLLPVSTIIALLRLSERRVNGVPLVKVMLFAGPDIDEHLKTPQIQAMNLQSLQLLELPYFEKQQAKEFVSHLFSTHGVDLDSLQLDAMKVDHLIKESGGSPAIIESGVAAILAQSSGREFVETRGLGTLLADLPGPAMVGAGAVILLVLATLVYQDEINALFQEKGAEVDELPTISTTSETVVPLQLPQASAPAKVTPVPVVVEQPEIKEAEPSQPTEEPDAGLQVDAGQKQAQEPDADIANVPATPVLPDTADESAQAEPAAEEEVKPDAPKLAEVPAQSKAESTPVKPPAESDEAWLLKQKAADYTLQLIGVGSMAAAKKYVVEHGVTGKARVFRSALKGHPWYSVVYGVYADRDAAVSGRGELPASLSGAGAWPRSFGSIQEVIKQRR